MKTSIKIAIALCLGCLNYTSYAQSENCLDFSGQGEHVLFEDVNDLGTSDFTIETWVYPRSNSGVGQKVISKGISSVGNPYNAGYGIRLFDNLIGYDIDFHIANSDGRIKFVVYDGITLNNWYHIAGVRSGRYLHLYVNGVLVASDSTAMVYDVDTDLSLVLGASYKNERAATNEFLNGKMDETRIWSKALSESEINFNKDCAITSAQSNLLAVYNLNLGSGEIVADSSGYENNGSIKNATWMESPVAPRCITSSVEEGFKDDAVTVFPNPFSTKVSFNSDLNGSEFKVFDMSGRLTKQGVIGGNSLKLDDMLSGNYILEVLSKELPIRQVIIKD